MSPRAVIIRLLCLAVIIGCSLSARAELRAFRTYHVTGIYVDPSTNTLEAHVLSQWYRLMHRQSNAAFITTVPGSNSGMATNGYWNTNWFFYGVTNFTAMSQARTNSGEAWWTKRCTLISPVLMIQCAHQYAGDGVSYNGGATNQWYLFLDATNGQHWRRSVSRISRYSSGEIAAGTGHEWGGTYADTTFLGLDSPLPAGVSPMPIVMLGTMTNKTQAMLYSNDPNCPRWRNCQHGITQGNHHGGPLFKSHSHNTVQGGDSGSPSFIIVNNRLLYCSMYPTGFKSNMLWDINWATTNAGFTTNQYPVQFDTLSQFPSRLP